MLEDFINSLTAEQKMALIETVSKNLEMSNSKEQSETLEEVASEPAVETVRSADPSRDVDLDFTVSKSKDQVKTKIPVNENKRFNSFTDDGTEAKGNEFKTPNIKPTERRRPPVKEIEQRCTKCQNSVKVHPTHAREWFVCDRCIGGR